MNIIKLQDKIMPESTKSAFFNNYLKGKYAYWVQMRYIVPFNTMDYNGYVACEEDINKLLQKPDGTYPNPFGCEYLDLYGHIVDLYDKKEINIIDYIDMVETDRVNNINELILRNNYSTSADLTINDIKKFRTWLAQSLLLFDTNYETKEHLGNMFDSKEYQVLNYYALNMMDVTVKSLIDFGGQQAYVNNINSVPCGCNQGVDLSSLYNSSMSVCDPISIYKTNIYNKMVEMFSNIDFWLQFPPEFISLFKHYIDNIIQMGLPLSGSQYINLYSDCVCSNNEKQTDNNKILVRLSNSLDFIYKEEYKNHINYIKDSFHEWASMLYEQMEW